MVAESADRGRWCALDSIKAAQNSALGALPCSWFGRYVTWCVSLWPVRRTMRFGSPRLFHLQTVGSPFEYTCRIALTWRHSHQQAVEPYIDQGNGVVILHSGPSIYLVGARFVQVEVPVNVQ